MGVTVRKVAEPGEGCCFDCEHYIFKMLMNISFETGHSANGVCKCENNGFYYTSSHFTCTDHKPRKEIK